MKVNAQSSTPDCIECTEAKLSETPYDPSQTQRETQPGELTHMDIWGKYPITSILGNNYYLLLVDDAARYVTVEFLKTKYQATQRITNYIIYLRARGKTPLALRSDRGKEFVNLDLQNWCQSQGIQLQLTAPYSPSQNGVAERMNCTLVELARAILIGSKLPEFLWEQAVAHAAYLRNISYMKAVPHATPYQVWNGHKPDVAYLRVFGASVWVLLQGPKTQRKLLPKSQRRAYVGYEVGPKAIKYYNPTTRNILLMRNFRFLTPGETPPIDEIEIAPSPLEGTPLFQGESKTPEERHDISREGELDSGARTAAPDSSSLNKGKRKAQEEPAPRDQKRTRGIRMDYKYMNDPFPDKEEAGIAVVREEAFVVLPDEDPSTLEEAQ